MRHILLCLVLATPTFLVAQEAEFENLTVLPKDISKRDLIKVMKAWTNALGVRCNFCHVEKKGAPLSDWDMASDDNKHKDVARKMVKMTMAINNDYMAKLNDDPNDKAKIGCRTCHHGVAHPRSLEGEIAKTMGRKGLDAAIDRYHGLRNEYYGRDAYDFGPDSLADIGNNLAARGKVDEGVRFLQLNLEFNPESARTHFLLGQYLQAKDKANALKHAEKAAALAPNWEDAQELLKKLKAN